MDTYEPQKQRCSGIQLVHVALSHRSDSNTPPLISRYSAFSVCLVKNAHCIILYCDGDLLSPNGVQFMTKTLCSLLRPSRRWRRGFHPERRATHVQEATPVGSLFTVLAVRSSPERERLMAASSFNDATHVDSVPTVVARRPSFEWRDSLMTASFASCSVARLIGGVNVNRPHDDSYTARSVLS